MKYVFCFLTLMLPLVSFSQSTTTKEVEIVNVDGVAVQQTTTVVSKPISVSELSGLIQSKKLSIERMNMLIDEAKKEIEILNSQIQVIEKLGAKKNK